MEFLLQLCPRKLVCFILFLKVLRAVPGPQFLTGIWELEIPSWLPRGGLASLRGPSLNRSQASGHQCLVRRAQTVLLEKEVESFGSHFALLEQFREGSTFPPLIVRGC